MRSRKIQADVKAICVKLDLVVPRHRFHQKQEEGMDNKVTFDNRRARQLRKLGKAFSSQPKFTLALHGLGLDARRQAAAIANPDAFLRKAGLRLPEGLGFELFEHPPRFFPVPDWVPWILELTSCRTYWVEECDDTPTVSGLRKCELRQEEVCFGFRIYPRPWPRGPYSL